MHNVKKMCKMNKQEIWLLLHNNLKKKTCIEFFVLNLHMLKRNIYYDVMDCKLPVSELILPHSLNSYIWKS